MENIAEYSKIVNSCAQKIYTKLKINKCVDFNDLVQAGYVGLLEAKKRFDPNKGTAFNTFAYWRINGAIIDALRLMGHFKRTDYKRIKEFCKIIPLSTTDNRYALHKNYFDIKNKNYIPCDDNEFSETLEKHICHQQVQKATKKLSKQQKDIINKIYFKNQTLSQWAKRNKLSKSWACRLHQVTISELTKTLDARPEKY
jgi:RNA polymerase sigma factor FliA